MAATDGQQVWSVAGRAGLAGACSWQLPVAALAGGMGAATDNGTGVKNASDKIRKKQASHRMWRLI